MSQGAEELTVGRVAAVVGRRRTVTVEEEQGPAAGARLQKLEPRFVRGKVQRVPRRRARPALQPPHAAAAHTRRRRRRLQRRACATALAAAALAVALAA